MITTEATRRDERQVAADTLALLLRAGVIRFDAISLAAAARATSIPVPEIEASYRAVTRDGRRLALNRRVPGPTIGDGRHDYPGVEDRAELGLEDRLGRNQRLAADGGIERLCSRCRTWLPETPENYFYRSQRTGEFMSPCKPCRRQRDRERQAVDPRPPVERQLGRFRRENADGIERLCAHCRLWLPETPEYFYYRNRRSGDFMSPCKPCRRELEREQQREAASAW